MYNLVIPSASEIPAVWAIMPTGDSTDHPTPAANDSDDEKASTKKKQPPAKPKTAPKSGGKKGGGKR